MGFETCGSDLTRSCVYNAAVKQTAWTGGGLTFDPELRRHDQATRAFSPTARNREASARKACSQRLPSHNNNESR